MMREGNRNVLWLFKIFEKILGAGYYALDNIAWLGSLGMFKDPKIYGTKP